MKGPIRAIGLMSGSSLDGLDVAFCEFELREAKWSFNILSAECFQYTPEWKERLAHASGSDALSISLLDTDFSFYMSSFVRTFLEKNKIENIDFVASHGHTVFHFPGKGMSRQIGNGGTLSALLKLPVICDFRNSDIALEGQGSPMVALTDKYLFEEYGALLNIGGIANISLKKGSGLFSYDICPANQVLNMIAMERGKEFDESGSMAASGKLVPGLLEKLNNISYYNRSHPKTLDNSFTSKEVLPLFESADLSAEDKLNTYCEHIAVQIANQQIPGSSKMLVTGGGALNTYLINRLGHHVSCEIIVPDSLTIEFKEALAVAFSGLKRWRGEVNFLSECSGAREDSCNGAIYFAIPKTEEL